MSSIKKAVGQGSSSARYLAGRKQKGCVSFRDACISCPMGTTVPRKPKTIPPGCFNRCACNGKKDMGLALVLMLQMFVACQQICRLSVTTCCRHSSVLLLLLMSSSSSNQVGTLILLGSSGAKCPTGACHA